jgi:4-amino-4-deoxy-L-arabinose transferase-like glycosyltransferase
MTPRRAALLIVLLAFALRVVRLDAQSLWYDEGLSVYLASLPLNETIAQSAVTDHPPLHAILLNVWMRLAGSSEFAARFASAFFGTLAVALAYVLGRKIGGQRVALITASLLAISPMAVWYGQEARGYSLLLTLALVAVLACLRLESGDSRGRVWLIYILACTAALYTHYFAAFVIAALNLAFAVNWLLNQLSNHPTNQHPLSWLLAQLAVVILFLPWLPNALAQAASNATYFPGRVTWDTVATETLRAFAGGDFPHLGQPTSPPPTLWLWIVLVALGALSPAIQWWLSAVPTRSRAQIYRHASTLAWLLVVPLALMAMLAWDKPKFAPRYLLPSLPAFIALAALGVDTLLNFRNRLLKVITLLPLAFIPFTSLVVTAQIYFDPPVARPDTRSAAAYIAANEQPGDAILLVGGHQSPVFEYYYRGRGDVYPLPPDLLPAAQSPLDARVLAQLADIAATHPRLWLVLWQPGIADPMSLVLDELRANAQRLEVGQNFHEMSLLLFDVREAEFRGSPQNSLDIAFADPIRLVGFDLNSNQFSPGQAIDFALYFQSTGPIERNYQVFTHLVGPDGSVAAQDDHIAGADSYPTSLWVTGAQVRNRFSPALPADLPPGSYRLMVGLYDAAGRLPLISGGDAVELATIEIR